MAQESPPLARLRHCYGLSPITALAFYETQPDRVLLLAGEDTWLKLYDVETCRLLGQLRVFSTQPIHGIHVPESDTAGFLIWGGQSVTLLPHASLQALISGSTTPPRPVELHAPDWIYDGILTPTPSSSSKDTLNGGAFITAHNEILPFTFAPSDSDPTLIFGPLASPSRPILYSANLALLPDTEEGENALLVAAGTVFGEIIVWRYYYNHHLEKPRPRQQWEVLHVLTGHEGSVFGVSIAPAGLIPGRTLLASCSDDRTVRVWDVTDERTPASDGGQENGKRGALGEARETGFGAPIQGADVDEGNEMANASNNSEVRQGHSGDGSARCVAVAMGHVSRIWHVKFGRRLRRKGVGAGDGGVIELYSFGEDCSRQTWELDVDRERWAAGGEEARGTLRHQAASTCHAGKNIWAAAVLSRGDVEPLVASGGADGRIVVSGRTTGLQSSSGYENLDLTLTFDEVLQSLHRDTPPVPSEGTAKKQTKHAFQRYAFISDKGLAATALGRLLLATMADPLVWEEVAMPQDVVSDLRPYNVLRSPAPDTALLGSPSGQVYLFRRGHGVCQVAQFADKISDIVLLDTSPSSASNGEAVPWSVIITVLGLDHAFFLRFDPFTNACTIDPRRIQLPEHYIVTAAAFAGDTLILGSRTGSVTVYGADVDTGDFVPVASRKDCRTKDAVTAIVPIPGNTSALLTTCRDGKYRIYTLPRSSASTAASGNVTLTLQHEISPPLNTLENAFFTAPSPTTTLSPSPPSTSTTTTTTTTAAAARPPTRTQKSELILSGFHGQNYLSYNATAGAVLARTPCGGAHRPFAAVSARHDPGQTRFVFTRASELRVVSQGGAGERIIGAKGAGGHGREIRSIAACWSSPPSAPKGEDDSTDSRLVATAAEDTSIRIWRHHQHSPQPPPTPSPSPSHFPTPPAPANYTDPDPNLHPNADSMECLAVIEGHSAGIQTLRWAGRDRLLSSAGSEELFVWRVSRALASPEYDALAVVREAVWRDGTPGKDLRVVDFDVGAWQGGEVDGRGRGGEGGGDGNVEETMLISMGLSDSSVRCYVYSPHKAEFRLLASARYTGACPTQVRHLRVDGRTGEVHVLTAFTDGHVAVWRTAEGAELEPRQLELKLVLAVRIHQSSIKSLDLTPLADAEAGYLVVTGGDDNALGFLDLAWDASKKAYVAAGRYRVKDAHAAAITGLCIVDKLPASIQVATISNDQRVKLWVVTRNSIGGARVALLDNQYSSVADSGDLELIAPRTLMVGGVGMEIWDVSG